MLRAMAEAEDVPGLATVWHLRDAGQADAVVPFMLGLRDESLGALLADEVIEETLPAPFPAQFAQHLAQAEVLPPLPSATVASLLERLNDPDEGLDLAAYEPARPDITRWVLQQKSSDTEDFALAILAGTAPGSEPAIVRAAARERVATSASAYKTAVEEQQSRLSSAPSDEEWQEGQLLFSAGVGAGRSKAAVAPLGDALLSQAPQFNSQPGFDPALAAHAQEDGVDTALSILETETSGLRPGLPAFAEAGLGVESPRKLEFFAVIARTQPELWTTAVSGSEEWSHADWKQHLRVLDSSVSDEATQWFIENAPVAALKQVISLVIEVAQARESDVPTEAVGSRIAEHLQLLAHHEGEPGAELEDDDRPEAIDLLAVIPWASAKVPEALQKLGVVLGFAVSLEKQAQLVADAFAANKLSATAAAQLVPGGHEDAALLQVQTGDMRRKLAVALLADREDETLLAIERVQTARFGVDLAEAAGAENPQVAFAGAIDAYPSLRDDEKDSLVAMLEEFGTEDEMSLLDLIMADAHKSAAKRRIRAADRAGELAAPRGSVPTALVSLLGAGNAELRKAAIRNIEKIRPRDNDVIGELRSIAAGGGVPGNLSAAALDAIAADIIDDLGSEPEQEIALELLPILGRAARACSFQTLFRFVGADAEWDDPLVRRVAASAIADAADGNNDISLDDQTALADLIEGEDREVDPAALDDLNHALSRVLLGADEALAILYDDFLPPKTPVLNPDALFGSEKPTIVAHLGLYSKARDRHERGRQLTQLDIVAAAIARAAYLHYGTSQALKDEIQASYKHKDYGNLIGAVGNTPKMKNIQGSLQVIHDLRSDNGQEAHPGEVATDADVSLPRTPSRPLRCIASSFFGRRTASEPFRVAVSLSPSV
jgi:hypothetical protein